MMERISALIALAWLPVLAGGQDRFTSIPGYSRYARLNSLLGEANRQLIRIPSAQFLENGRYIVIPGSKTFDTQERKFVDSAPPRSGVNLSADSNSNAQRPRPERGRQYTSTYTADGVWVAEYKEGNIIVRNAKNSSIPPQTVTTDGDLSKRIKYGSGSWVYGEELNQNEAMWWSPDGTKLAFYRFDDSMVLDYYLTLGQGGVQNRLQAEAYPKAGTPNPKVELSIWDRTTNARTKVDTTFPGSDPDIAHYIYAIDWQSTGELTFHRTNRKQNTLEWCAADPTTGRSRVIVAEQHKEGWTDNHPPRTWLQDRRQFVWISERNGFRNLYLGSLSGEPLQPITQHPFEVERIVRIDEKSRRIWYMARSDENPYHLHLHRIGFDGKRDRRLTQPGSNHAVQVSENGWFVDTFQSLTEPPVSQICDPEGKVAGRVGQPASNPFKASGYLPARRFKVKSADGKWDLYGYFRVPAGFDASKKYPLILNVYGGPESGTEFERFLSPDPVCELGFITAWVDARGTQNRGRAFRQSVYRRLGVVEIDDMAATVRQLGQRFSFIDTTRVGIEGTSYGGYASIMALVRHPDVFHAACAQSSVTSWHHYDTIYTERYMDTPQNNPEGYKAGSAMEYARQLKGQLLLFYGTADDNVHPSNTHNLIRALDAASKPYRLFVGVDQGHAAIRRDRMLEFFIDTLKPTP